MLSIERAVRHSTARVNGLQWDPITEAHTETGIRLHTHTHIDKIHQSSILHAWTFVPKGLYWYSSFQRTIAFELPKARWICCDRFTHSYTNTQTIWRHTSRDFLEALEGRACPFSQTLSFRHCSQNSMAKHPGGHTLDYDVSLFLPLWAITLQPLCLAMGTVLFYLNINLIKPLLWKT